MSGLKCCVVGCNSTRRDTALHSFPKTEIGLQKWLECIRCDSFRSLSVVQLRRHRICRKHFEKRFHTSARHKPRLRVDAFPTLFTESEIATGRSQTCQIALETASGSSQPPSRATHAGYSDHIYTLKRKHEDHTYSGMEKRTHTAIGPLSPNRHRSQISSIRKPMQLIVNPPEPSTSGSEKVISTTSSSEEVFSTPCASTGSSRRREITPDLPVKPDLYTIVIQQETDQDSLADKETDRTNNELVQKQYYTIQKQNNIVQKQYDTVHKQNGSVQRQQNILQKAMMHAELPDISGNDLFMEEEYTMYVDENDNDHGDGDDDHPWHIDDDHNPLHTDDANKDIVSFVEDPELEIVGNDIVIETQPLEQTSCAEVLDSPHVTQSSETTEQQVVQYGQCRCCLEMGTHTVVDVIHELGCFNIPVETDPRLSRLVCSACGKFLQEVRRFRDMAVASQRLLLENLTSSDVKYPAVWSNPSGVIAAHEDEFEQELLNIQQLGLRVSRDVTSVLKRTDDGSIQDEMSDDVDTKVDIGMPDDGETQERPVFSRLSDYPDAQMGTEVNYDNLTEKDFKEMVQANKRKRAKFSIHIRQNLIMILDYSTVLPFLSVTGEKFECIYCDGTFHHIGQLRAHVEGSHRNEETEFKHDILKLLPETILFVDVSSINCRLCDEQLTTIDNLVQHLVETHKKRYHKICLDPPHNIVPFNLSLDVPQCVECGKTFPDYKKLRLHVIKHYGPYLCHQCGSKFLFDKQYHQHMRIHQESKKNKQTCDECGLNFRNKKLLLFHYYNSHYNILKNQIEQRNLKESTVKEGNITYECTLCNNGTTYTLTAAYMHRIGHLNNTREGPYSCEVCGHTSPLKKEFRAHLQTHYGIKKFVCKVCKKTFKKNSQLSDHMSVHLNLRFHCPLCDTTVYDKKLLMRHVKNQHPDVNVAFSL